MKAWQSTSAGIDGLVCADLAPPQLKDGHSLIRVEAAGLNFSDLLMIDDRYQVRPPRPFVPGQEVAGRVVERGPGSTLSRGDRVAAKVLWGGFAEYAIVRDDMAIHLPTDISSRIGVALPISYVTAMVALTESTRVNRGETVLVLAAAGGVGLAAVEIGKALGARVFAAAGGAEKCRLAVTHGADEVIDYRRQGWHERVKSLTEGRGVDVVVDPVGGAATNEALRSLDWQGRLLVVGFASGEIPKIPANRLLLSRASAIGVYWSHDRDGPMLARVSNRLTSMLCDGALSPHIGSAYRSADLPQALAALSERQITGKAILTFPEERI